MHLGIKKEGSSSVMKQLKKSMLEHFYHVSLLQSRGS
jgi:hypothetical protein